MTTYQPEAPEIGAEAASARTILVVHSPIDRTFRGVTRASGTFVLLIMVLVGAFLTVNATKAISSVGLVEFVTTQEWSPETNNFGIAAVLTGTVLISLVALVIALPLSLGAALFITEIATGRMRTFMTSMIDLMAAVPSVVFGLWGLAFLPGARGPVRRVAVDVLRLDPDLRRRRRRPVQPAAQRRVSTRPRRSSPGSSSR